MPWRRISVQVKNTLSSLLLIGLVLNLTTGCFYYKVTTKADLVPEDIRWEDFNQKYLILHDPVYAWHINDVLVDTNTLVCKLTPLPPEHQLYQRTDPVIKNKFKKTTESLVLNEVHLYTSDLLDSARETVSVDFSSIDKMEVYYYDKKSSVTSHVLPTILIPIGIWAIIMIIILLTKSSCPYVYILDDNEFKFVGEIYSGAVYSSLERNDYLPLPGFEPTHGKYTVKIANRLPEIQFLNLSELWLIDHPETLQPLADRHGIIHTIKSLQQPVAALSGGKADLSGILAEKDGQLFLFSEEPDRTGNKSALNSVELTFDVPEGIENGKLVIKGKNSYWGDYVMGEMTKYFGERYPTWIKKQNKLPSDWHIQWRKAQSLPLMVYVETKSGWEFVDYYDLTGPLGFREMVMPIDLSDYINATDSQINVKLETGFAFWELDYAAMDFSADEQVDVKTISLSSAFNESGKEVMKQLTGDDKKYYIQPFIGDEVVLEFDGTPEQAGTDRSVILHTKGYYNHVRYYDNDPDREMLETFRRPGRMSEFSFERYEQAKISAMKK
jgi:hypothetical protein